MRTLRRFLALPPDRRRLVLGTAALSMPAVRVGLWVLPLGRLRRALRVLARPRAGGGDPPRPAAADVVWAVEVAARYVPRATCLVRALTLELLLRRSGRPAELRIGVAKEKKDLKAHAWVESEGRRFLGGPDVDRFAPLPSGPWSRPAA